MSGECNDHLKRDSSTRTVSLFKVSKCVNAPSARAPLTERWMYKITQKQNIPVTLKIQNEVKNTGFENIN